MTDRPTHGSTEPHGGVYDWYTRGMDLLATGNPAAAATLLSPAADAEPESPSLREALARAQFDAGQYEDSAESFGRIVERNPVDDYARFGLGLAYSRVGRLREAAEHLALAFAMRPEHKQYARVLQRVRSRLAAAQ